VSNVVAIVEGRTEQIFVRDHLAAYLGARGVYMTAQQQGGVGSWKSVRGDILDTLWEWHGKCVCTTMFDYYAMPTDWPGRTAASKMPQAQKGRHVEQALLDDLAAHAGADFRRELFIPYVQVHEFEAILFAGVTTMATALAEVCRRSADDLNSAFQTILDESGQAEAINDSYDTCPSRRITGLVRAYNKTVHGPIIAGRIGLDTIRAACPHFGQWLGRLEALGAGIATM